MFYNLKIFKKIIRQLKTPVVFTNYRKVNKKMKTRIKMITFL